LIQAFSQTSPVVDVDAAAIVRVGLFLAALILEQRATIGVVKAHMLVLLVGSWFSMADPAGLALSSLRRVRWRGDDDG